MRIIFYTIIYLFIYLGNTTLAVAQNNANCGNNEKLYKEADRYYNDGDVLKAESILLGITIEDVKCPELKKDLYFLKSKLQLLTGQDSLAIKNYKKVLILDPAYELNKVIEPADMVYFANRYRAVPLFSITPSVSLLRTIIVHTSTGNSIEALVLDTISLETKFSSVTTYGGQLRASFYPSKHWEVGSYIGLDNKQYEMRQKYFRNGIEGATNETLLVEEKQRWLSAAAMLRYNIGRGGFYFGVFGGYRLEHLNKASFVRARRGDFDLIDELEEIKEQKEKEGIPFDKIDVSGNEIDITNLRKASNSSAFIGIGCKLRLKSSRKHFITFDIETGRSRQFFNENLTGNLNTVTDGTNSEENRALLNETLLYGLGYMEDNMKIRYFQFSLGYSYTVYRVMEKGETFTF